MRHPITPLLLLSCLGLAAGAATAQQQEQDSLGSLIERHDADGDRLLSAQEFEGLYREKAEAFLAAQDQEDARPILQGRPLLSAETVFLELDADDNQALSRSELSADPSLMIPPGRIGQRGE